MGIGLQVSKRITDFTPEDVTGVIGKPVLVTIMCRGVNDAMELYASAVGVLMGARRENHAESDPYQSDPTGWPSLTFQHDSEPLRLPINRDGATVNVIEI